MSKFTWRNIVSSSGTLVKSHKGLEGTGSFAQSCFRKKLIWKISQKIHAKETIMKAFLELPQNLQLHWKKEPHQSYFPMTFEKIFQNTVLYQDTGKRTEKTEVFARICFRKKPWRNCDEVLFQLSLQLYLKRTPSQLFSYVIEAIKIPLEHIRKMFKIPLINN